MKSLVTFFISSAIALISYIQEPLFKAPSNTEFEFTIQGNVGDGDGIVLSLYIPSQGLDSRIKSTIKNGKYVFKGKSTNIERCKIRFEENIIAESSSYSYVPVFIEPGNIYLDFKIMGDSLRRRAKNKVVSQGDYNKFYKETSAIYYKHASYIIYSDKIKNDSMHQYVYPEIKKKVLNIYDSMFLNIEYDAVALAFLKTMVAGDGLFEPSKLKEHEAKKLIEYFEKIDPSLNETPDYRQLKNDIDKIRFPKPTQSFKDFELMADNDEKIRLSDIVKQNKFTILYFWWSGCLPCRKFNQATTSEAYAMLKERKIEIVSISVDQSKERWKRSSKKDIINWTNLYAGAVSTIEMDYNVEGFPTKIIFNTDFNVIDFDFKEASELMKLVKN